MIVYHPEDQTVTMDLDDLRDLDEMFREPRMQRQKDLQDRVEEVLHEGYGE